MESFLDLYFKSVQENSLYKEPCVLIEKWKAKLNSPKHLCYLAAIEINANWRMKIQVFSDSA